MTARKAPRPRYRVRRVTEHDLEAYRAVRLRALAADRLAFGSTLERERAFEESLWKERLEAGATSRRESIWLAEGPRGRVVGMIGSFTDAEGPVIVAMWVEPRHRGHGVGGALLDALLAWLDSADPPSSARLSVNPDQSAAVALYRSRGFRPTGRSEPLPHAPTVAVVEMRRPAPLGPGRAGASGTRSARARSRR